MAPRPFQVRFDEADHAMLTALARRLGYTESDALRYALRHATGLIGLRLARPITEGLGKYRPDGRIAETPAVYTAG